MVMIKAQQGMVLTFYVTAILFMGSLEGSTQEPSKYPGWPVVAKPTLVNEMGIYPTDNIRVAATYYFAPLNDVVFQFDTILADRLNLAFFTNVFQKEGGLQNVDKVLDLGTGYGAIGLMAIGYGAKEVVATDIDPLAVENARFNAKHLGIEKRFEVRLVPKEHPEAFSVIKPEEKFDLIVSDPPQMDETFNFDRAKWDDKDIRYGIDWDDYSFLRSFMAGLSQHLTENGRALVSLRVMKAKEVVFLMAAQYHLDVRPVFSAQGDLPYSDEQWQKILSAEKWRWDLPVLKSIQIFEIKMKKSGYKAPEL